MFRSAGRGPGLERVGQVGGRLEQNLHHALRPVAGAAARLGAGHVEGADHLAAEEHRHRNRDRSGIVLAAGHGPAGLPNDGDALQQLLATERLLGVAGQVVIGCEQAVDHRIRGPRKQHALPGSRVQRQQFVHAEGVPDRLVGFDPAQAEGAGADPDDENAGLADQIDDGAQHRRADLGQMRLGEVPAGEGEQGGSRFVAAAVFPHEAPLAQRAQVAIDGAHRQPGRLGQARRSVVANGGDLFEDRQAALERGVGRGTCGGFHLRSYSCGDIRADN